MRLEETGVSLKYVARNAEVSYEQLKKLKQIDGRSTNVDDAIKIAEVFGMTVNDFVSDTKSSDLLELISLLKDLSPEVRDLLVDVARARAGDGAEGERSLSSD